MRSNFEKNNNYTLPKQPPSTFYQRGLISSAAGEQALDWDDSSNHNKNNFLNNKNPINNTDSHISNQTQTQKSNSKLYTFYDYINKNKSQVNSNLDNNANRLIKNTDINSTNQQQQQQFHNATNNNYYLNSEFEESTNGDIIELNTPLFERRNATFRPREPIDRFSPLPEPHYITMPISSGFGGYTGTTRRKPQPKVIVFFVLFCFVDSWLVFGIFGVFL